MRLLLDTHALIWWLDRHPQLSARVLDTLLESGHDVFVSAVSGWEIATKVRVGKLQFPLAMLKDFEATVHAIGCLPLVATLAHGTRAGLMPGTHRDPFDRLLAAQSDIEEIALVTRDPAFLDLGTRTFW